MDMPRREAPRPPQPPRRTMPEPRVSVTRRDAARRTAQPRAPHAPLSRRRRARRNRTFLTVFVILIVLAVIGIILLWQPFLRVSAVDASGPDADALKAFALSDLEGSQYLVIPKNSLLFLPIRQLRADILAHFPDIEAVSIAPANLTTLSLTPIARSGSFWWCGPELATPADSCYQADATGFIFAAVATSTGSTTMLSIYAPLAPADTTNSSPAGRTIANAAFISPLIEFVKGLEALGANVRSVNIRGDEADLYTGGNTRITYVLGREQQAAQLAASAFPQLNVNDGSLLYVDLRFADKVYFKRTNDKSSTPATL